MRLEKYDAARRALSEATRVDEVKSIRDKAMAMRIYAEQAKDITLISKATELRMRAERRAGELLHEMQKNKGAREQGVGRRGKNAVAASDRVPKLSDLGVSKTQSSRWQKLAEIEQDEFEQKVDRATEQAIVSIDRGARKQPRKTRLARSERKRLSALEFCIVTIHRAAQDAIAEGADRKDLLREIRNLIEQLEEKND